MHSLHNEIGPNLDEWQQNEELLTLFLWLKMINQEPYLDLDLGLDLYEAASRRMEIDLFVRFSLQNVYKVLHFTHFTRKSCRGSFTPL